MDDKTRGKDGDGRGGNGRFLPGNRVAVGNRGGLGRPKAKWLRRLRRRVNRKEWDAIVLKAIELAKAGDPRAREWIGKYVLDSDLEAENPVGQYEEVLERLLRIPESSE